MTSTSGGGCAPVASSVRSSLEVYNQVTDDEQRVDKCSKTIEHVS